MLPVVTLQELDYSHVCLYYIFNQFGDNIDEMDCYKKNVETEWAADILRTPHNVINVNMIFAIIVFSIDN